MKIRRSIVELKHLTIAVQGILAIISFLNIFKIYHHPTIHRATIPKQFNLNFNLNQILIVTIIATITCHIIENHGSRENMKKLAVENAIIALITAITYPIMGLNGAIAATALTASIITITDMKKAIAYTLISLTSLETIALAYWLILYPLALKCENLKAIAEIEYSLYYIVAQLTPLIMLPALYHWIINPIIDIALKEFKILIKSKIKKIIATSEKNQIEKDSKWKITLIAALILSIIASIYPYHPNINPQKIPVGVDVKYYVKALMKAGVDINSIITSFQGSRPLIVALLYALWKVSGLDIVEVVKYTPLLLNPLLALSSFCLVYKSTGNKKYAALASLITSISTKITVNMYSYFLTNMLALALMYSSIALLISSIAKKRGRELIAAIVLASAAIFTHPWTYTQYASAVALMLIVEVARNPRKALKSNEAKYLITTMMVDFVKEKLIGVGSVKATMGTVGRQPYITNLINFWDNMIFAFRWLYGGFLSNPLIALMSLIAIYMLNKKEKLHEYLIYILITSSIVIPICNGSLQSRLIFNLPLEVLVAYLLYTLYEKLNIEERMKHLIATFTIIALINCEFKLLANLI